MMRGKTESIVSQANRIIADYVGISQGEGITIPTWLMAGGVGLFAGIVLGPSIMASTATGSAKLAELSRSYIERH